MVKYSKILFVTFGLFFLLFSIGVFAHGQIGLWDGRIYDAVSHLQHHGGWLTVNRAISFLGEGYVLCILALGIFVYLALRTRLQKALWYVAAFFVGFQFHAVLKILLARPRPEPFVHDLVLTSFAYPSGHAMGSILFALLTWWVLGRLHPRLFANYSTLGLALLCVLLIGLTRIFLGVHWASDVVGGFAFGLAWFFLVLLISKKFVVSGWCMKKYKLYIFDLDGTLIDSRQDIADAVNHALLKSGLGPLALETIQSFVGSGLTHLLKKSLAQASKAYSVDETLDDAVGLFNGYYDKHCLRSTTWYPQVLETLMVLSKTSRLAVMTNKPKQFTDKILRELKADRLFIDWVCGDSGFAKKPDPAGANYLLQKAGVKNTEALLVGDSHYDLACAMSAGIDMAYVTYGFETLAAKDFKRCTYVIKNFGELKNFTP